MTWHPSLPVRRTLILLLVILVALLPGTAVLAAEPITGDNILIDEDVADDLYVAGQNITVNATIDGDLVAVGSSLTLNGTVTGDLLFAGQWLIINGEVQDDARIAGMTLVLEDGAVVGDDIIAAGYALEMRDGSSAGGNVYAGAAQIVLADVGGDVLTGSESIRINGQIAGSATVSVGSGDSVPMNPAAFMGDPSIPAISTIPGGLTFGSAGEVAGDLSYESSAPASIPGGAVAGEVSEQIISVSEEQAGSSGMPAGLRYAGYVLGSFVVLLGVGLIGQRVFPAFFEGSLQMLRSRPLPSLGIGLLGYSVVYVFLPLLVLLFLVFLFLPLAGAGSRLAGGLGLISVGTWTVFRLATRWIAPLIMAMLVGGFLYGLVASGEQKTGTFWPLAVGVLILSFLLGIPLIGRWALAGLVGMFGLGAMFLYLRSRSVPPAVAAPAASGPAADVAAE